MRKNKNKWIKFRHKLYVKTFYLLVKIHCRINYHVKITPFNTKKQNYVFIMNHQTGADQLFLYLALKNPVYFLATEDVFSNGFSSRILEHAFAPIPFNKTATDIVAIKNCLKIAKNKGSIAICPEGNRTYSGKTEYIKPSIVKLLRALKLPIALFIIEGGYGVQPRWADKTRKGKMQAKVKRVIEKEEYDKLSDEEFFDIIQKGLFVDEHNSKELYKSNKKAEYLERVAYTCPYCGFTAWKSSGNIAECLNCHKQIEYTADKKIKGIGFDFPYKDMGEWYYAQEKFVSDCNFDKLPNDAIFTDKASLKEVIPYKKKILIAINAIIKLFKDKVEVFYRNEKLTFNFSEIEGVAVLGKNKLNINIHNKLYQFKGEKSFNALKFINFYYKYKNSILGENNGNLQFLGL